MKQSRSIQNYFSMIARAPFNKLSTYFLLSMIFWQSSLAFGAFGLSTTNSFYTIDTGAGLVFSVRRTDNGSSTQSPGDLSSIKWNGTELQNQSRGSQINSGFDWLYKNISQVSVFAETIGSQYIKVTVSAGDLTHYYMARKGYPHIYMATYFEEEPDIHGHVRYILRLDSSILHASPVESDISAVTSTIEASDIFALANGETRSKHYSNMRLIDWSYIGATGNKIGMWVVRDNHEGGSGGPFYRSLLNQKTSSSQEITYIVNYAQNQTEAYRTHVLNSYTFVATHGGTPSTNIDKSWFKYMNLLGYVDPSEKGSVAAVGINNRKPNYKYVVGFANDHAQYWAHTDASSGYFKSTAMIPGTYQMTTYKGELAVDKRSVDVNSGGTTVLNSYQIINDPSDTPVLWRVGDWDGTPHEFLNGSVLTKMHPSDARISTWDPSNYIIGKSSPSHFPAYMWKDINSGHRIYFRLSESASQQAHTVRIGLTCAYSGGRPNIKVNGWTSRFQSPSSQPSTRSMTTGSYRGNNTTYYFEVPSSAWNAPGEWNTLQIDVISGSGGSKYLSAGFCVDAIDLVQ